MTGGPALGNVRHALTLLCRLCARRPAQRHLLRAALAGRLAVHADDVVAVALAGSESMAAELAVQLRTEPDLSVVSAVLDQISEHSTSLADAAVVAMERLLATPRVGAADHDSELEQARLEFNLAQRHYQLENARAGMACMARAAQIFKRRVDAGATAFLGPFALAASGLAVGYSMLGAYAEALASAGAAVTVLQEVVKAQPGTFDGFLAEALFGQATRYAESRDHHNATIAASESVTWFRRLAEREPERYRPWLAHALGSLAIYQGEIGELQDALATAREAAALSRRLVEEAPGAFATTHAEVLDVFARRLLACDQRDEANGAAEAAVAAFRKATAGQPAAFRFALANATDTLASVRAATGQLGEAAAHAATAVELMRVCFANNPTRRRRDLARLLHNASIHYQLISDFVAAEAASAESVKLYLPAGAPHDAPSDDADVVMARAQLALVLQQRGPAGLTADGEPVTRCP